MKCSNCGETLKDEAKVCFACGEKTLENERRFWESLRKASIDEFVNGLLQ